MKKQLLFFALTLPIFTSAQSGKNDGWLIPFLAKNGKIGYVNEAEKMVIEPQFDGLCEPFRAGDLSTKAQKNGQMVRVFRSGHTLENPRLELGRSIPVIDFDFGDRVLDTLRNLVATRKGQSYILLDLASGRMLEIVSPQWLSPPNWAKLANEYVEGVGLDFRLRHGAARLFRADGRVNFFDKNLKPLFSSDFAAGCVADERFFIVAEAENRFGVADRTGKIVLAPNWKRLEPGGQTGLFFANRPNGEQPPTRSAGLIDASGKVLIDTIFSDIKAVPGGRFFIVSKDSRYGLFDVDGRSILPVEQHRIIASAWHPGTVAVDGPNSKWNLLDRDGRRVLPADVDHIESLPFYETPHFRVSTGETTAILDTAFRVLFEEKNARASIVRQSPFLFFVQKKGAKSRIVSRAGKTVFEADFDQIENAIGSDFPFLFLKKDTVRAIISTDGKMILPFDFSAVSVETRSKDTLFWGKPLGQKLFFAHDRAGKRVSAGFARPDSRAIGAVAESHQLPKGRGRAVVLFNGERHVLPDSLKDCQSMGDARFGENRAIIAFGKRGEKRPRTVVNERFESILPVGFAMVEKTVGENAMDRLREMGLVVVKNLEKIEPPKPALPRSKIDEKPREISSNPNSKKDEPPGLEEPPMLAEMPSKRDDYGVDLAPFAQKTVAGVVDLDGKWLVGPTAEREFLPLSAFMVAEFQADAGGANHSFFEKGIRLHVVAGPEKGKIIDANWLGRDGFDEKTKAMKIGRVRKGTTRMAEYAYFDEKGQPLTEWIFENGPDFLGTKNLVHIWQNEGTVATRHAVIDASGKIIFELGEWITDEQPRNRGGDDKWAFLVVKGRKMGQNQPEGLMDSTGRLVLPVRFFDLKLHDNDRFFTAKKETEKGLILNFEGQELHVFEQDTGNILSQKLGEKTGFTAVWNDRETVILSPENRVVQRFSLPVQQWTAEPGVREKMVVLLAGKQTIFADFRTGKVFSEK